MTRSFHDLQFVGAEFAGVDHHHCSSKKEE